MSINRVDGSGLPPRPGKLNGEDKPSSRTEGFDSADRDVVELSSEARLRAALERAAAGLPEVRQERIEALRREIDDGSYAPDPRAVARSILEFEDGLGI